MGTRSDIIVQRRDGTWKRIYCHWDGYPSHNGQILVDHYSDQKKAEKLVAPGDMSSLDAKCSKPKGHSFDRPVNGYCVYYGRDRGETEVDGSVGASLMEVWPGDDSWTEFTYVWDGEQWLVSSPEAGEVALVPVVDVLKGEKTVQANIKFPLGILGKWNPKSDLMKGNGNV